MLLMASSALWTAQLDGGQESGRLYPVFQRATAPTRQRVWRPSEPPSKRRASSIDGEVRLDYRSAPGSSQVPEYVGYSFLRQRASAENSVLRCRSA
jgi:hypothetical protein